MKIIKKLAPHFKRYITIEGIEDGEFYSYRGAEWPMVRHTRYLPKCKKGESWMYVAIDHGAELDSLQTGQSLYIGSQTQDRMFRGNDLSGMGLGGNNYHHAEMRKGAGLQCNLISHLKQGRKVEIHRISAIDIRQVVEGDCELRPYLELIKSPEKHMGYWMEQIILDQTAQHWQWNSMGAEQAYLSRRNQLGIKS